MLPRGEVIGVEALARWTHPQQGAVSPELFVALAERSGLILELTATILEQALDFCRACSARGRPISVAVNLSPRALLDANLLPVVREALGRHPDVLPSQLTLEITESSVLGDPEAALLDLGALRQLGI